MADQLALVESRIAALERIVFGSTPEQKEEEQTTKLVDKLVAINNKLAQATSNNEKVKESMKELISMRQYLDPSFVDNLTAPLESKFHILELSAKSQENRVKLLEQLKASESVLDSEHIRKAPALAGQLAQISLRQSQQADALRSHTSEVSDLFKAYSELVLALSKQAAYWDQTITALETSKQK